jgi:GH15 family glucan-1,4-alpha-glucosidase
VIEDLSAGRLPAIERMLPTRYALDGDLERLQQDDDEPWPNFQLDGYGTWLHELGAHQMKADSTDFDAEAVELAARYLAVAWQSDCYDCWEEFGDGQHASTLAAIAAGLRAAARLLDNPAFLRVADEVVGSLHANFVRDGYVRKGATDDRVDASLLSMALPLQVFAVDDPIMQKTAGFIRRDLRGPTGGVYRYLGDTYFGGGEWILLTAWLGWYDVSVGDTQQSAASRDWVRARVTAGLELPEQTTDGVQDPTMTEPWTRRWGPVATPLLWSHAMYLLLSEASH